MYWPIGPPKAYALEKHKSAELPTQSHDGSEGSRTGEEADSSKATSEVVSDSLSADSRTVSEDDKSSLEAASETGREVASSGNDEAILAAKVTRGGSVFATLTRSRLTIWQTKPAVALASVVRSPQSMKAYGPSTALLLRPDGLIIVVQTAQGYLITYSLSTDPNARVYTTQLASASKHGRHGSEDGYNAFRRRDSAAVHVPVGEGDGIKEVNLRFRMVIRIDAGINTALALDDELMVATAKPAAVQCIRWVAEGNRPQTSTEVLSKMEWMDEKSNVVEMVFDRPMNLATWLTSDGKAYAVQRRTGAAQQNGDANATTTFRGFCFREPASEKDFAVKAAINARFSLIAVGRKDGGVDVYAVKDYVGNIPLSHKLSLPISSGTSGMLTTLSYSPDGYCLFAGYEKAGQPGASTENLVQAPSGQTDSTLVQRAKAGFMASETPSGLGVGVSSLS